MRASSLAILCNGAAKYDIVISSSRYNFNLYSELQALNWGGGPAIVTVTINSGVYIGSNSTSTHSFDTGGTYTSPMDITIINNGYILGRGGDGSSAVYTPNNGGNCWYTPDAQSGGPAFRATTNVKIYNNGTIGGGGGGGGHGETAWGTGSWDGYQWTTVMYQGGGGGGGAGYPGGSGASGMNSGSGIGGAGSSGSTTSGGGGGGTIGYTNVGGSGGSLGASGASGSSLGGSPGSGCGAGSGGAGGVCIAGNSFITWNAVGTRYGSIT